MEKQRIMDEIRTMQQQLELKELVIECFIPERQQMKV